ncbi:MAG: ornithine carbamoyltransferase, partial [Gemmatimonadaceae bacterium]
VDGIMIRTFAHSDVEQLAEYGSVPVINGLTDLLHPCQVLADLLTVRQQHGTLDGAIVAWVGDGNNMANSWINAAYRLGFELRLACPAGYEPDQELLERAQGTAKVRVVRDPREAAQGATVVTTDVWASMGQEEEQAVRAKAFAGYVVDAPLMKLAAPNASFLHCLPAHRGEEVAAEVIDGPQSRVWDEAENRLHIQKAIMAVLIGGEVLA